MICIDGSQGEGGGQILRSALTLSALTGKAFRIDNIRAGRPKPGLLRQHLTAVSAAAAITAATVSGDVMGSQQLTFEPGPVCGGIYDFAVGTAGSTMLVLQTILLPLMLAGGDSQLTLEGGTHNPFAPPFDFLQTVFVPLLKRMGGDVELQLMRPGFYPAGGGRVDVWIKPVKQLQPLVLNDRGALRRRLATATVANLRREIAERELQKVREILDLRDDECRVQTLREPPGPGNIVTVEIECEHVSELVTAFGQKRTSAEEVGREAAEAAAAYLASGVAVGEHLADQLLLPLVLAGGGEFTTCAPTSHTRTNIEIIKRFLDVEITLNNQGAGQWTAKVNGSNSAPARQQPGAVTA